MEISFRHWFESDYDPAVGFADDLKSALAHEQLAVAHDRERYLQFVNNKTLAERLQTAQIDPNMDPKLLYATCNRGGHPVRDGIILANLHRNHSSDFMPPTPTQKIRKPRNTK